MNSEKREFLLLTNRQSLITGNYSMDFQGSGQIGGRPPVPQGTVGFPWRIFVISVVLFGLVVLVWAGMTFGYGPFLKSEIKSTTTKVDQASKFINEDTKQSLISFYSQLYNIQIVGGAHVYPSALFPFLEQYTYSLARLVTAQVNVSASEVRLEGIAADFTMLTEQVAAYKSDARVVSVSLESSRRRDQKEGGGIAFSMRIIFDKSFFLAAR